MIQIDKCVEIPAIKRNVNNLPLHKGKYPWQHMVPGDSFFVPSGRNGVLDKRDGAKVFISTAIGRKKIPGSSWAVRSITENGVVGVRVWRVS